MNVNIAILARQSMADGRLLLDLPPELLLKAPMIPASPRRGPGPFGQTAESDLPDPAILAMCRRINAEAAPTFYSSNIFCFSSGTRAHDYFQTLAPHSLALIRNLEFHYRVKLAEEQDWIMACDILAPDDTAANAGADAAVPHLAMKTNGGT
ncbi:hypothetical protein MN608_00092 [Microdochium nivale]|nr:hypothetical protein MN608_00092 [Microdochium nivale]